MKILRIIGKSLISMGVGVLLFVAWTLWGTGIYTAREQRRLAQEFAAAPDFPHQAEAEPAGPPAGFNPNPGDPVFRIRIPAIDVRQIVVEGVDTEQLRLGPGHYPVCSPGFVLCLEGVDDAAWPGEDQRVIVSGHRTTFGAPFWDLDKLGAGDALNVDTKWGDFTYEVTNARVVDDASTAVVLPGKKAEIVLTTCNPKFSAAQRLVVFAELKDLEA
jgi:sortase A